VVDDNVGVVKVVPVAIDVPPVAAVYQLITPALAVALSVNVPEPHLDSDETELIVGTAVTDKVTALDVAVLGLGHVAFDVITTVTTSLLANDVLEYVELFVPTLLLFTFH
jgi:hypothetical protein